MTISTEDLRHLARCVELAETAVGLGDEPFGSVLVAADGTVLLEDHNRVSAAASTPATAASCTAARTAAHGTVHGEPSAVTQ